MTRFPLDHWDRCEPTKPRIHAFVVATNTAPVVMYACKACGFRTYSLADARGREVGDCWTYQDNDKAGRADTRELRAPYRELFPGRHRLGGVREAA